MKSPALGQWPSEPPTKQRLEAVIRSLAHHSDRIDWSIHAFDRIGRRNSRSDFDLNDKVAMRVLRTGDVVGVIRQGRRNGEWIAKVIAPFNHERGARNVGVVTVIFNTDRLFVKTVEWEDKR